MSLVEIQQLTKKCGIKPQHLPDSMIKQTTWDNQWIGYDDGETFAAKQAFADGMCIGDTMIWNIDFQVPRSGGARHGHTAVRVCITSQGSLPYKHHAPPCTMSIELSPGTTTPITAQVPALTTNSMEYDNVNIISGVGAISYHVTPLASSPPEQQSRYMEGPQQVRILVLSHWPTITRGPPDEPALEVWRINPDWKPATGNCAAICHDLLYS
ncbi:hypothetical protein VTK56DRAFT_7892 [Thermocarpiscus australiensis]